MLVSGFCAYDLIRSRWNVVLPNSKGERVATDRVATTRGYNPNEPIGLGVQWDARAAALGEGSRLDLEPVESLGVPQLQCNTRS
jgi:hypothetical protein